MTFTPNLNGHLMKSQNAYSIRLMKNMGWKEGSGLGSSGQGRKSPIKVQMKNDKIGIKAAEEAVNVELDLEKMRTYEEILKMAPNYQSSSDSSSSSYEIERTHRRTVKRRTKKQKHIIHEVPRNDDRPKKENNIPVDSEINTITKTICISDYFADKKVELSENTTSFSCFEKYTKPNDNVKTDILSTIAFVPFVRAPIDNSKSSSPSDFPTIQKENTASNFSAIPNLDDEILEERVFKNKDTIPSNHYSSFAPIYETEPIQPREKKSKKRLLNENVDETEEPKKKRKKKRTETAEDEQPIEKKYKSNQEINIHDDDKVKKKKRSKSNDKMTDSEHTKKMKSKSEKSKKKKRSKSNDKITDSEQTKKKKSKSDKSKKSDNQ